PVVSSGQSPLFFETLIAKIEKTKPIKLGAQPSVVPECCSLGPQQGIQSFFACSTVNYAKRTQFICELYPPWRARASSIEHRIMQNEPIEARHFAKRRSPSAASLAKLQGNHFFLVHPVNA
ncbi:MAG: hypothetical protein Q8N81_00580, partial [bacterium]|nr:hypothetical protein [bacterium]